MIRLVAFDLVQWIVPARVMDVALVIYVLGMDPHDTAANPPSLGIPAYVIADPKRCCHDTLKYHAESGLRLCVAADRQRLSYDSALTACFCQ
jgi:hypothetical protein